MLFAINFSNIMCRLRTPTICIATNVSFLFLFPFFPSLPFLKGRHAVAQGGPRAPGKELAPLPPARRDTSQKRYTSFKNLQELPELNWASKTYKDGSSAPPINFEKCTMIGPTEVRKVVRKKVHTPRFLFRPKSTQYIFQQSARHKTKAPMPSNVYSGLQCKDNWSL